MTLFLYYNGSAVRSEGLKEIQVNLIYIGVLQSKVTSNLVSPSFDSFLQKPYVPENAIKYFFFSKQLFIITMFIVSIPTEHPTGDGVEAEATKGCEVAVP